MSKTTDDAYERAHSEGGCVIQTRAESYYADRCLGELVSLAIPGMDVMRGKVTGIVTRQGATMYFVRWQDGAELLHFPLELKDMEL
jgi:hypothetical protein